MLLGVKSRFDFLETGADNTILNYAEEFSLVVNVFFVFADVAKLSFATEACHKYLNRNICIK